MPIPLDTRKKPIEIKVNVSTGAGVDVKWSDGHASHYDFPYLRDQCPCAMCNDERAKKANLSGGVSASPLSRTLSSAALPMYKPKVTARSASAVGSYAVQINFSDGHTAGIFSFEHLREICPCKDCARDFRS
ncbi:MAG: gamma-butyrobetaine hydroxylase-like domain-containing protein [Candidatus Acidiferrales bacterium]